MNVKFLDAVEDMLATRQASRAKSRAPTTHERCKECGLKIRRPGHAYGHDHIRRAGKSLAK